MTKNVVYAPSRSKDPKKYDEIPRFEKETGHKRYKLVAAGFAMRGKIAKYIEEHRLASYDVYDNFNGYGYADTTHYYLLSPRAGKELAAMLEAKEEKDAKKPPKIREDTAPGWARRLSSLSGEPYERCLRMAYHKLEYQEDRIRDLENLQLEGYSVRRQKLIDKLRRENPLRRIKNEQHAKAVIAAERRHGESDYDEQLAKAKDLARWGFISRRYVREYALANLTYRQCGDNGIDGEQKEAANSSSNI